MNATEALEAYSHNRISAEEALKIVRAEESPSDYVIAYACALGVLPRAEGRKMLGLDAG